MWEMKHGLHLNKLKMKYTDRLNNAKQDFKHH